MNTIYILWLRQLKRYVRSKSRLVGSLGQPILFLVALGYGFGPVYQQAGQGSYLQYLTPGIIGMSIIFTSVFSGMEVIWDRQFGFLKETMVAPVSRVSIMLGRTLGGATVATCQGTIVLIISVIAGFRPERLAFIPFAIATMLLIALLFTSLGTAIASILTDMQGFQLIVNFLIMPLFFLSGSMFPLKGLPPVIMTIATLDPLTYGVDALRGFLIGASHFPIQLDLFVVAAVTLFFVGLGSYLFTKIEV